MRGVLNEESNVIHKHEPGEADFQTECGVVATISHEHLSMTSIESAYESTDANKCGRCFDDGGGY